MSDDINRKHFDSSLTDLKETEQETLVGGFGIEDLFEHFFLQKTDISTFAQADTNDSSTGISTSHKTGYKLSQITIAFSSPRSGGRRSRSRRSRMRFFLKFLQDYLTS